MLAQITIQDKSCIYQNIFFSVAMTTENIYRCCLQYRQNDGIGNLNSQFMLYIFIILWNFARSRPKLQHKYVKGAVAHDNKKLLYLGHFSILLVQVLHTGR